MDVCGTVIVVFFFQAEDGIRDLTVTGVQTCALPIYPPGRPRRARDRCRAGHRPGDRSEEHTSELQSQSNLVCRLLLEKKKLASSSPIWRGLPRVLSPSTTGAARASSTSSKARTQSSG